MATVRKVIRTTASGRLERWQVSWVDPDETRHARKFTTKAAATSKHAKVVHRLEQGLAGEGADVGSVLEGCQAWVDHVEGLWKAGKRERSTWKQYDEHLRLHIALAPVAKLQLKTLTAPECQQFAWWLEKNRNPPMARAIWTSFKSALGHCVVGGLIPVNPAASVKIDLGDRALLSAEDADAAERAAIPALADVRATVEAAKACAGKDKGRALAVICLVTFAGLRISELRGLGRAHLQLFGDAPEVKVRRRADRWNTLGPPKSKKGYRTIPLGPMTLAALRAWSGNATWSQDGLAFPTESGKPYSYSHLYRHLIVPVMAAAGLVTLHPKSDGVGKVTVRAGGHFAGPYCPLVVRPRYSFHVFRHVAASLWIDQGMGPKRIQALMGHSSITTTMNLYGHLFARKELEAGAAKTAELTVMTAARK